jgi:NitT/TauT family transport system substrate-binding protein
MKKIIGFLGVLVIVVLLILMLGKNKDKVAVEGELQKITIAVNPWIGSGLYYVAEEQGFFESKGVDVVLKDFLDGSVGKQLIASGSADAIASLTPETVILLADAGVGVKVIAMTDLSTGADGIIVDESINSLEDLRGKKVAFESGSPSQFFLEYVLNEVGMSSNDLEVIDTPSPDAGAAFVSGAVDAAVTWEPWISQANNRQGGKVLVNSTDVPILPGMLIARDDAISEKSTELLLLTEALFETADWIDSNQDAAAEIMARRFAISKTDVVEQYPTFIFLNPRENAQSFAGHGDIDIYELMNTAKDIWSTMGYLDNASAIDPQNLLTDAFIGKN